MNYLVAYDITSNRQRKKVADYLESIGVRINKSVFLLTNCSSDISILQNELSNFISKKDEVFIVPLCKICFDKGILVNKKPKKKKEHFTLFT